MLDWPIIGGGIQGTTLATYLIKKQKAKTQDIRIIDPHSKPLSRWEECTSEIGMKYLRSPSIHHLDPEPFALEKFAKKYRTKDDRPFLGTYDRPSLELFNEHCQHLFDEVELASCWIQGRVECIQKKRGYWRVLLVDGTVLDSKQVVVAIGIGEKPIWPEWAIGLKEEGASVCHLFDEGKKKLKESGSLVITGGGITAAHTALKWGEQLPGKVILLTRHTLRVHQFDSHPGWLGPKLMRNFQRIKSYEERRATIRQARNRGSMPLELKTRLLKAEKDGKISIIYDEVDSAKLVNDTIRLQLKQGYIEAGQILLATGFDQTAPGMNWLMETQLEQNLRCAACGYPIVDSTLKWDAGLYVLGALAELEVGPVARNISGARRGAERIIQSI